MVYRQEEVVNKVQRLLADVETEVVEYKSAKNNFDFDDLGKYFSALSTRPIFAMPMLVGFSSVCATIGRYVGPDTAKRLMSQALACVS